MKKKKYKFFIMILMILTVNIFLPVQCFADNPLTNPSWFEPSENRNDTELMTRANMIIGTIQTIGIVVAVITITILGIKYMTGSLEQKAEYKKTMIPYIVGVFFLVGTVMILEVISKLKIFG